MKKLKEWYALKNEVEEIQETVKELQNEIENLKIHQHTYKDENGDEAITDYHAYPAASVILSESK